jgi:hypothetical protein
MPRAMRLIILIFIGMISLMEARMKCGMVIPNCVPTLEDGKCPYDALCPPGLKRKPVEGECCCIVKRLRRKLDHCGKKVS